MKVAGLTIRVTCPGDINGVVVVGDDDIQAGREGETSGEDGAGIGACGGFECDAEAIAGAQIGKNRDGTGAGVGDSNAAESAETADDYAGRLGVGRERRLRGSDEGAITVAEVKRKGVVVLIDDDDCGAGAADD